MSDSNTVTNNIKRWACENDVNVSKTIFLPQHLGTDFKLESVQNSKKSPVFQFICVSTIEPRKGYLPLLKAFIKALDEGLNARLIVVGRPGWKADDEIELLKNNSYVDKNIFWENNCSDDRLRELYSQSHCFIFASYDEGFGLGIVEAAQSGLPLFLRDIPVFREIAGDHALYFTDENLTDYLKLIVSGKKKLPSIHGMKILTWKQSVHESASQFVSLAKNEFFSYMKDPIKKVSSETITELIFEDSQENTPLNTQAIAKTNPETAPSTVPLPPESSECDPKLVIKHYSPFNRLKFRILLHICPSAQKRQHYRDKLNGVPMPAESIRPLSLTKRITYAFGSCCAPTEAKRKRYALKLKRAI